MIEFVAEPREGRRHETLSRVRLSDVGPSGLLRLDGVARTLQDVATDDWDACGIDTTFNWLARRTAFRFVGDHWPAYEEHLRSVTWCAGTGAAWAERRTNVYTGEEKVFEAASLWVPVDAQGFPQRIPAQFHEIFGLAMGGRKISGRVDASTPPDDAQSRPFALRRSDLDVIGHVNNAAVWHAVSECVEAPVAYVEVVHRGSLEGSDEVTLATSGTGLWLLVNGDVRVSAHVVLH
jgi:acyl-ACP thioesterase